MIRPTAEGDVPTKSCAGTIPVEGSERSNIEDRRGGELAVVDEESEETFEEALEDEHNDDVRFVKDI